MRPRHKWSGALMLIAAGCSREDAPAVQRTPAETPSPAAGHAAFEHAAVGHPTSDAEVLTPPPAVAAGEPSRAQAAFSALRGSSAQGVALLDHREDGVRVTLQLPHVRAGRVLLRADGTCPDAAIQRARPDELAADEVMVGALVVDKQGRASMDVTLKDANLTAGAQGTLLGQALLVYQAQPGARKGQPSEKLVACAQILAQ